MEFAFRCRLCGVSQAWTSQEAAHAAAAWHVHDDHRDIWAMIYDDRDPRDRRPEDLGHRFEEWERQS